MSSYYQNICTQNVERLHDISWLYFNHWVNKCTLTVNMNPLSSAGILSVSGSF